MSKLGSCTQVCCSIFLVWPSHFYPHLSFHRIFPICRSTTSVIIDRLIIDESFCRSFHNVIPLEILCLSPDQDNDVFPTIFSSLAESFFSSRILPPRNAYRNVFHRDVTRLLSWRTWFLIKLRIAKMYLTRLSALSFKSLASCNIFVPTHMPFTSIVSLTIHMLWSRLCAGQFRSYIFLADFGL